MRVPAPTARLVFRAWRERNDDLPLAMMLWGDRQVAALVGGPFTIDQVRERLAAELTNQREHGIAYWPIGLHDGTAVGCCGLKPRAPSLRVFELGFYLAPPHWAQGLATEAARSVIEHAFGTLGATVLFAGHHPDNHGSKRSIERLGFSYTHHELYPPTGLEHPGYELRRPGG